jgi:thiol:disulfide interchange protein DsbD
MNGRADGSVPETGLTRLHEKKTFAMKVTRSILFAFIIMALCAPTAWGTTATVAVVQSRDGYPAGGSYPILFRIRISDPWAIHETGKSVGGLIPTVLSFKQVPGVQVVRIRFPESQEKQFSFSKETIKVYAGSFLVSAVLKVGKEASEGERKIMGSLSYQACSDVACLPPETVPISFPVNITATEAQTKRINDPLFSEGKPQQGPGDFPGGWKPGAGLWLTLLGIFLGGMALNLTPCVYPLIPITVSYFGGRSGEKGGRPVLHGILYMLGLAATNASLGAAAALSGGMLGSVLQNPLVLMLVAVILVGLATSFFGLWEIRIPSGLMKMSSRSFGGYFGTFFMGLTLGIVAAPCLGPFLLGLLTFVGQLGNPVLGILYFFVLSLGLGLPLAVLGVFSSSLERLPLSGEWMVWIRKCFGWILIGMAGYVVLPLLHQPVVKSAVAGAVMLGAGLHLGWVEKSRSAWRGFGFVKRGVGLLLLTAAAILFLAAPQIRTGIKWVPYDASLLKQAASRGRPVLLDFYADWCSPCRAMDKEVFSDSEVVNLSRSFLNMRMDLTTRQPAQEKILRKYGVRGVPTTIFINREGLEERDLRIEQYTGKDEVLLRMRKLLR